MARPRPGRGQLAICPLKTTLPATVCVQKVSLAMLPRVFTQVSTGLRMTDPNPVWIAKDSGFPSL